MQRSVGGVIEPPKTSVGRAAAAKAAAARVPGELVVAFGDFRRGIRSMVAEAVISSRGLRKAAQTMQSRWSIRLASEADLVRVQGGSTFKARKRLSDVDKVHAGHQFDGPSAADIAEEVARFPPFDATPGSSGVVISVRDAGGVWRVADVSEVPVGRVDDVVRAVEGGPNTWKGILDDVQFDDVRALRTNPASAMDMRVDVFTDAQPHRWSTASRDVGKPGFVPHRSPGNSGPAPFRLVEDAPPSAQAGRAGGATQAPSAGRTQGRPGQSRPQAGAPSASSAVSETAGAPGAAVAPTRARDTLDSSMFEAEDRLAEHVSDLAVEKKNTVRSFVTASAKIGLTIGALVGMIVVVGEIQSARISAMEEELAEERRAFLTLSDEEIEDLTTAVTVDDMVAALEEAGYAVDRDEVAEAADDDDDDDDEGLFAFLGRKIRDMMDWLTGKSDD